jgi:hypothetical protein
LNEQQRKERNTDRLSELYKPFADQIASVIAELEGLGYRPRIQEAYRSPEDQMKAYRTGHSKLKYGFHNVTAASGKPEGLAVDLYDDDRPLDPTTAYLLRLSAAAWARGLGTGVLWGLSQTQQKAVKNAIAAKSWQADVRTGWDSWHIEPVGITPAEARSGARPKFKTSPPVVAAPEPAAQSYSLKFPDGSVETTHLIKDRSWFPIRTWGEKINQPVVWQGDGLPILMGGQPSSGEMQMIGASTCCPVRDLAAFSGLALDVDNATRTITVRAAS